MKASQSSLTAEGIAMIRASESARPADVRICYDPYAIQFLRPLFRIFLGTFMWYGSRRSPGVAEFLIARTRMFDDSVSQALQNGLQQLVILGAGFDSRAYRFEGLKHGVKVFEVDHPATQAVKLEKLKKIFGTVPNHVAFVPIDFDRETLLQRLVDSGYDERLQTLFLWEGVTYYITAAAIDATLDCIAHHSGPGSSVIFDYIYQDALTAARKRAEVSSMRRYQGLTGEGLVTGFEQGAMTGFLCTRGFDRVEDYPMQALKDRYFVGADAARPMAPIYAIVQAWVNGQPDKAS